MLGALSMRHGVWVAGLAWMCLALAVSAQEGTYYKWTDAAGTVHFSATPPPGRQAKALKFAEHGSDSHVASPAPPTAGQGKELDEAKAAYRRRSCDAARSDLKVLAQNRMVVSGDRPDAATKLDVEQRAQAKLRAQQRVKQFCEEAGTP
jgi:hypothetical protein